MVRLLRPCISVALLLALAFAVGCAGNYYEQYTRAHPDWDEIFPRPGATLEEVLAAIHTPRRDRNLITIRRLEIWRTDVDPWESIRFADLRDGSFAPSSKATYAVIANRFCRTQADLDSRFADVTSWYLLTDNALRSWKHFKIHPPCVLEPDFTFGSHELGGLEKQVEARAAEGSPENFAHSAFLYSEGLAYVRAGRFHDGRQKLEDGDRGWTGMLVMGDTGPETASRHRVNTRTPEFKGYFDAYEDEKITAELRAHLVAAIDAHERAESIDPGSASALLELAEAGRAFSRSVADTLFAQPLVERAVRQLEQDTAADPVLLSDALSALGRIHATKRAYPTAEALHRRALSLRVEHLGRNHPKVADSLLGIAVALKAQGERQGAAESLDRALEITATANTNRALRADLFETRGLMHLAAGDLESSERDLAEARSLRVGHFGRRSPEAARALAHLAAVDIAAGRLGRAKRRLHQLEPGARRYLSPYHPDLGQVYQLQAHVAERRGEIEEALEWQRRSNAVFELYRNVMFALAGEEQRRAAIEALETQLYYTVDLGLRSKSPAGYRLALTGVLQRKGRVLDAARAELLEVRLDPEQRRLVERLNATRARIAALVLRDWESVSPATLRDEVLKLEMEAGEIEAAIISEGAGGASEGARVTINQVQATLSPDEALIEFIVYRPFEPENSRSGYFEGWGDRRYAACVLRSRSDPQCIELGVADSIEASIRDFRAAVADARSWQVLNAGRALDSIVMQPVRSLLKEESSLFVAPAGALNLVPFAALSDEDGRFLIDRFTFTYLTSGRDRLRDEIKSQESEVSVIIANPDFDGADAPSDDPPDAPQPQVDGLRSVDFGRLRFTPLPGTLKEAQALKSLLREARVLTGGDATEEAVKGLHSPRILHIATHGFFLPDLPGNADVRSATFGSLSFGVIALPIESSLLRSGLALAGANQRSSGGEDGVLTALELMALDLAGTELVVLSACETGVGLASNGDGVYGLRRALVIAGAATQVMSLWHVLDDVTSNLMVDYYRRLVDGAGRSAALRDAQLSMKAQPTLNHPFYWASFITAGDSSPLETL